jgi:protein tyrosine/serine phosphatase
MRKFAAVILLLLAGGCATVGRSAPGLHNLATVDPAPRAIYRGGQPTERGIETLTKLGVKTVIDLRNDPADWEASAVADAGMTYVNIRASAFQADPKVVEVFLRTVATSQRPIYVHCKQGRDRTGLGIAAYRLVCQPDAWTRDAALHELRAHGYQWFIFPKIERYIRSFDPRQVAAATQPSANPLAQNEAAGRSNSPPGG